MVKAMTMINVTNEIGMMRASESQISSLLKELIIFAAMVSPLDTTAPGESPVGTPAAPAPADSKKLMISFGIALPSLTRKRKKP
jgi:hypothetical protein